jgi:predicted amidohydrolase YtcJ
LEIEIMKIIPAALIAAVLFAPHCHSQSKIADVIFKSGNIYTANERQPRAEAIAVQDGKILVIGSNAEVQARSGPGTRVVDLRRHTVVPGLADSHYHLAGVGDRERTLNLEGTASLEEFLAKVKERIARAQPGEWVTGRGWIETFWRPQVFPTRWDLDKISPSNPVFLVRADGHGAVANSAALQLAGINKETSNPSGGEIMRNKATGEPNGMLVDRAQRLISQHIAPPTEAESEQALLLGVKHSLELGWTQIQNAGSPFSEVERLKKLYAEGRIKLRIYQAIRGPSADTQRLLSEGAVVGAFGNRLTVRTIKVSMDGALGSMGAALLEPYADHDTTGLLMYREEDLMPMFLEALRKGIQIETHAIGDRANRIVLDLYEKAFQTVPPE